MLQVTPVFMSSRFNEEWLKSGRQRVKFDAWPTDGGGGRDSSMKWTVMSRVILKPGMRKEASASLIQHGQNDCLPLLSLLTVFVWLRIHASSLARPYSTRMWKSGIRRVTWPVTTASFEETNHFACEGGWWRQTAALHTLSCHLICVYCRQKELVVMHQCYTKTSKLKWEEQTIQIHTVQTFDMDFCEGACDFK